MSAHWLVVADSLRYSGAPISIDFYNADLQDVLRLFADISGLNVVVNPGVGGRVTLKLNEVPWDQVLDLVLRVNGLVHRLEGNVLRIARPVDLVWEERQRAALGQAELPSTVLRQQEASRSVHYSVTYHIHGDFMQQNIGSNPGQAIQGQVQGAAVNKLVAERLDNSFNVVAQANSSADLKAALGDLHAEAAKLVQALPPSGGPSAEDVANQLEVFEKQAIEKRPLQGVLKVTGAGLLEFAKLTNTVAQVATALNKVAGLLGYPSLF